MKIVLNVKSSFHSTIWSNKAKANLTVIQLADHRLQLKIIVVGNRNIRDRRTGKKGLNLNFSGRALLVKNFSNFNKVFWNVRVCWSISSLMPEPTFPLTLFSDVASARSKTTSRSDSITCQSVEDNFKDKLKKLRVKNLHSHY